MQFIAEKLSLLRWSVHYEGLPFTLLRIAVKASALVGTRGARSEWFQHLAEQQFDKRFHVETSGLVKPSEMQIPDDRIEHAVEYAPTSANRFGWLLSKLPIDINEFVFVDFGSGKGRPMLMASEFPFKRVLGVELASGLHDSAVQNIQSFRSRNRQCHEVHSLNQDATQFQFPEEPLVLFFFNPFSAEILQQVVDNLQASLNDNPREVIVLYYNPLHADVFQASPLFTQLNSNLDPGPGWELFISAKSSAPA